MLKKTWKKRYKNSKSLLKSKNNVNALIGFNANIDLMKIIESKDIDNLIDQIGEKKVNLSQEINNVHSLEDVLSGLYTTIKKGEARELNIRDKKVLKKLKNSLNFDKNKIGGQAGIISSFLSELGVGTILSTPLISEELADHLSDKILCPENSKEGLVIKNIKDCINSKKTKTNIVLEFRDNLKVSAFDIKSEDNNRLILSDRLKGFEPLFNKKIEIRFNRLFRDVDRVLLAGFQNLKDINHNSRLEKTCKQIKKIKSINKNTRIHLEFTSVRNDNLGRKILEEIGKEVHSLGGDETEIRDIISLMESDQKATNNELNLTDVIQYSQDIMEHLQLERLHVHTYNIVFCMIKKDYSTSPEKVRKSLLLGGQAASYKALTADIPSKQDLINFYKHEYNIPDSAIEDLKEIKENFDLNSKFSETGIGDLGEFYLVAVPNNIIEEPELTVGLGDLVSSGSFVGEVM